MLITYMDVKILLSGVGTKPKARNKDPMLYQLGYSSTLDTEMTAEVAVLSKCIAKQIMCNQQLQLTLNGFAAQLQLMDSHI